MSAWLLDREGAWHLLKETFRSGLIASLVMMPAGFAFKALDMRVGHYGPKVAEWWVSQPSPAFLFGQHLVIGWLSTLPLLWWCFSRPMDRQSPWVWGVVYGAGYYVLVNSLALPIWFDDPLPWQLGWTVVVPSLVVHVVFGLAIGLSMRRPSRSSNL